MNPGDETEAPQPAPARSGDSEEAGRSAVAAGAAPALGARALAVATDAALIAVFVAIGRDTHHVKGVNFYLVKSSLPWFVGWFGAAWAMGLYRRPLSGAKAAGACAVGIPLAITARALLLWRPVVPVFALLALGLNLCTLVGWRLLAGLTQRLAGRRMRDPEESIGAGSGSA